jgi:sphinganine-1-phosphate aldolase
MVSNTISRKIFYTIASEIDRRVQNTPPWKLVAYTAAAVAFVTFLSMNYNRRKQWNFQTKVKILLRLLPKNDQKVNQEFLKLETSLEQKLFKDANPAQICKTVPFESWGPERIIERLKDVAGTARSGKNTGAYYIDDERLDELILQVCRLARRTNPLHLELSPLIRQLESEVVRMTACMFKGDEKVVGCLTSGGTDSISHAVFTARERAKFLGLGADWEMVVPETAHPAFDKAANEYCIKIYKAAVYPQEHPSAFELDVDSMKKMITSNTILVVGSMPPFPHGIPDNVEEISRMLETKDPEGRIGLHVDGCLGGFVIPWMEAAGYGKDLSTKFGFDVKRVTSVSADTHKYGYADKGSSVVLYRDFENWMIRQVYVTTEWQGGMYATPTKAGSRPGKDIAATWAVMSYMGQEGYIKSTSDIIKTTRAVTETIRQDPFLNQHLAIMGNPKAMVVAFCSKDSARLNIYDLKKELNDKEWYLSGLQKPPGLHLCTTAVHGNNNNFVKCFIADLKACVQKVLDYPPERKGKSCDAVMYCTNEKFGESIFIDDLARHYWNVSTRVEPVTFKLEEQV